MRKSILAFFILVMFTGTLFAQSVNFDTQVRYRGEFSKNMGDIHQAFKNATAGDSFELLRTRIGAHFTDGSGIGAYLQIQDSRAFGEEFNTLTDAKADALDLHQGFIVLSNLFDSKFNLKLGRMELAYGNQRLVGAVNWSNTGRAFDGAQLVYHNDKHRFDLFQMKLTDNTAEEDYDPEMYFSGAWYTMKPDENRTLHIFGLSNFNNDRISGGVDDHARKLYKFTGGFDYSAKKDNLSYEVEGAYQFGKEYFVQTGTRLDVGAYMFGSRVKYNFESEKKQFLGVGFDYLSGDDDNNDDSYGAFNTLYATGHKYFGYMDYYLNVTGSTGSLGLMDMMVNSGITLNEKASLAGDFHILQFANENFAGSSALGSEIDLTFKYKYAESVDFQAGASIYIPGEVMKNTDDNDSPAFWFYTSLVYNFNQGH